MRRLSGPSSTSAPSLRSSVAMASSRSLSLMRRWATLKMRVSPSAKGASAARVGTWSGMVGEVGLDAHEPPVPRTSSSSSAPVGLGAHLQEQIEEPPVALARVAGEPFEHDLAAGQRRRRGRIAGGRPVPLDPDAVGARGRRDAPARLLAQPLDPPARGLDDAEGDVYIGPGGERLDLDRHLPRRPQRRHQEGREVLARLAGVEQGRARRRACRPRCAAARSPRRRGTRCGRRAGAGRRPGARPAARAAAARRPAARSRARRRGSPPGSGAWCRRCRRRPPPRRPAARPGSRCTSSPRSSTRNPQRPRAARKRWVSSASSGRSTTIGRRDSSARLSQRWLRLLDDGTRSRPALGRQDPISSASKTSPS